LISTQARSRDWRLARSAASKSFNALDPAPLARELEDFLATAPQAFVLDDGEATIFDFVAAKYSVSREWGKCLLHLRSSARNTVRRIVDVQRWSTHARIAREQAVKRCLCSIP
jgi:hypothetical protein